MEYKGMDKVNVTKIGVCPWSEALVMNGTKIKESQRDQPTEGKLCVCSLEKGSFGSRFELFIARDSYAPLAMTRVPASQSLTFTNRLNFACCSLS